VDMSWRPYFGGAETMTEAYEHASLAGANSSTARRRTKDTIHQNAEGTKGKHKGKEPCRPCKPCSVISGHAGEAPGEKKSKDTRASTLCAYCFRVVVACIPNSLHSCAVWSAWVARVVWVVWVVWFPLHRKAWPKEWSDRPGRREWVDGFC
jgi:hypothetical protein